MAETSTLINAEPEITSEVVVSFTPFMLKTIRRQIKSTVIAANDMPNVIKNVFKIFLSFALKPIMIEKSIIEINIKNSTIISATIPTSASATENSPVMTVDNKSFNV